MKPIWRWWLFCLSLRLYARLPYESRGQRLALGLMGWTILPTWVASEEEIAAMIRGEVGGGEGVPF